LEREIQVMKPSPTFTFADLQHVQPIQGWQEFLHDGEGFLKTAVAAHAKRKKIFTAEILYNIVAMAIEKFVMAALMRYGTMPYNHTMVDLVAAMEETFPGKLAGLRERLLQLDKYQEICDLEGFSITPPGMEKIPAMLETAAKLQVLVIRSCRDALPGDIPLDPSPGA
jgi:hypothetical protein